MSSRVWYPESRLQNGILTDQGPAGDLRCASNSLSTLLGGVLTTRGDVLRRGASAAERLALGAAGTVLTSDGTDAAWAARGKVLQVVETVDTTVRSTTSATPVDSSIAVAITPSAATSRVLLAFTANLGISAANNFVLIEIRRDTTSLLTGSMEAHALWRTSDANESGTISCSLIDSPATTSAVTYRVYFSRQSSGTAYLGRRGSSDDLKTPSILRAMEIAA